MKIAAWVPAAGIRSFVGCGPRDANGFTSFRQMRDDFERSAQIVLAKFEKNWSASFLAVPLIRR